MPVITGIAPLYSTLTANVLWGKGRNSARISLNHFKEPAGPSTALLLEHVIAKRPQYRPRH